jgi:hypothetical protein
MDKMQVIFNAAGKVAENQIEVTASTVGTILRNGCVFAPSAFSAPVLRDFVTNGAILVGHDWDDLPIGYPESAKLQGNELVSVARFHSTESGQEARTIAIERMQAGRSVSVSIGFMPDYGTLAYFNTGAELLNALEGAGENLTPYDAKSIKAWKQSCHLIRTVTELYEWSIVLTGMNQRAKARQVQSFESGSTHGLDLETHLEFSLAGIQRAFDVASLRQRDGRRLSEDRRLIIRQIHEAAGSVLELSLDAPEPKDDPISPTDAQAALIQRALQHRAYSALMGE